MKKFFKVSWAVLAIANLGLMCVNVIQGDYMHALLCLGWATLAVIFLKDD